MDYFNLKHHEAIKCIKECLESDKTDLNKLILIKKITEQHFAITPEMEIKEIPQTNS